jgi:hypothetical protein
MDITQNTYGTKQPKGSVTTLLDLVSRDLQDNTLFPLNASVTRFTRDEGLRTIPMSSIMREFTFRGPASFGQTFTFEIGDTNCGDLISGLFIQLQFSDWYPSHIRRLLIDKIITPQDPSQLWTYCNSLGTSIIEEATLEVDDQVLERITGDSIHISSILFPDLNTQVGLYETLGIKRIDQIKAQDGLNPFFTEEGWITVPLMFSMLRQPKTSTFPIIACREGTIRIRITLKRFDQIVRIQSGSRASCNDTPLSKTPLFSDSRLTFNRIQPFNTLVDEPKLQNIQLLTQGFLVDGPYREMLLRQPFEKPFREIQQFDFTEPLKYVINKSGNDLISVQLPLEANQPVEEIIWFVRRKAAITLNNDWTNYSATLEKDYDPTFAPLEPLLVSAKIQANGMDIISQDEAWFRSHIARAHRGGNSSYDAFLYGYSFARHPGQHDPTGSMNASRLNSLRLTLNVKPPEGTSDTEWEVRVFVFAFQWVRFGNGICNKVFID